MQCSGEGHEPPKNRVGLSFGAFQTRLQLEGDVPLDEAALGVSYERQVSKRVTLQVSGGWIPTGHLFAGGSQFRGGFFGFGASFNVLTQKGAIPFLMLGVSASGSMAVYSGSPNKLYAADIRGSVTSGYSMDRFTPYLVGRVFGGPVFFERPSGTSSGTDRFHYQLGIGLVVSLPKGFDLSVELVPFGEQRVSAGIGYAF